MKSYEEMATVEVSVMEQFLRDTVDDIKGLLTQRKVTHKYRKTNKDQKGNRMLA